MLRSRAALQVCRQGWGCVSRGISSSNHRSGLLDSIFGSSGSTSSTSAANDRSSGGGSGSSTSSVRNGRADSSGSGGNDSGGSGNTVTNARAAGTTPAEEAAIKTALAAVVEPVTGKTLMQLGSLQRIVVSRDAQKGTCMTVHLDLLVPGHPRWGDLTAALLESLHKQEAAKETTTHASSSTPSIPVKYTFVDFCAAAANPRGLNTALPAMKNVQHVIAISSCKGGVGKSTVAVNLACELASRGLRVGLLDADIYGPSVPVLLPAADRAVRKSTNAGQGGLPSSTVVPLSAAALPQLKMLSFGHVNSNAGVVGAGAGSAAVVRGPVASRVVSQLVGSTEWGCLDYLLVDMPPGTGDIHITLTQSISFSGAVLVTTPHKLALADAVKGLVAFDQLRVPVLNVVQNMAYIDVYPPTAAAANTTDSETAPTPTTTPTNTTTFAVNGSGSGSGRGSGSDGGIGTRFYPFGRGGRAALVTGMQKLLGKSPNIPTPTPTPVDSKATAIAAATGTAAATSEIRATSRNAMLDRLHICPLFSLPLEAGKGYVIGEDAAAAAAGGGGGEEGDNEEEQVADVPLVLRPTRAAATSTSTAATTNDITQARYLSEVKGIYSNIADSIILEVLQQRSQAILVPSLSYDKGRGIVVRYYTPAAAEEFVIPVWELLSRDATTGTRRQSHIKYSLEELKNLPTYENVHVLKFDIKGNYGVLIEWSGTQNSTVNSSTGEGSVFMDITRTNVIPFDVLRAIAEEMGPENQ